MFNDLQNSNNQTHSAVDDIFAETDKAPENSRGNIGGAANISGASNSANSEIEAQKVGLAAEEETKGGLKDESNSNKWFKIILISIVAVIIILSAYLVYSKFLKPNSNLDLKTATSTTNVNPNSNASAPTTATVNNIGSLVATTSDNSVIATSSVSPVVIPLIPGVNAPATTSEMTASTSLVATSSLDLTASLDSDSDGLTNIEEQALGTNLNVADTDGDGLSDYEEVKIYHTDPLNPDTDGDGFSDGMEVKSGYNPLGAGKIVKTSNIPSTDLIK